MDVKRAFELYLERCDESRPLFWRDFRRALLLYREYPGKIFPDGIFHIYDYFFFYNNIKENVKTRLEAFKKL